MENDKAQQRLLLPPAGSALERHRLEKSLESGRVGGA